MLEVLNVSNRVPSLTPSLRHNYHIHHLTEIRHAALAAADPTDIITRNLHMRGNSLFAVNHQFEVKPNTRIFLIALGKAALSMCQAAVDILGDRLEAGVATVPHNHVYTLDSRINTFQCGHPLPDEGSLAAGLATYKLLSSTRKEDLVLTLISGGGSAMFELPLPGINLEDLRTLNTLLLHSGAPIEEINTVRCALSQVKAGGLARIAAPARAVALILSDVVGDRLTAIASGPTVLSKGPIKSRRRGAEIHSAAQDILAQYDIWSQLSDNVRAAFSRMQATPVRARRPKNFVVGNNKMVVNAAVKRAASLGFTTEIVTLRMQGEARDVGSRMGKKMMRAQGNTCLLMGGETTVTVRGTGLGGRNQELSLAAAITLEGIPNVALMALATDGVDGPTDAAGAIISGDTILKMRAKDFDPNAALSENASYHALNAAGALLLTGPTGTNLNDIVVGLVYK